MSLAVACCFVLLQHRSRSHFLGPVTITSGPLRTLLDMLVLSLLFCAHAANMFLSWHGFLFHNVVAITPTIGLPSVLSQYRRLLSIQYSLHLTAPTLRQ